MQDPWLLEMTASEPMSMQEEYENQISWKLDPKKLTFIVCTGHPSATHPDGMIGDVNAYLSDKEDEPGKCIAELEVMIAEKSARRKGFATEAIQLLMKYICQELPQVVLFMVKISDNNMASSGLFNQLGFRIHNHAAVFEETEWHMPVDSDLVTRLDSHWKSVAATVQIRRLEERDEKKSSHAPI